MLFLNGLINKRWLSAGLLLALFSSPVFPQYFQPISRSAHILDQPYKFRGIYFYFIHRTNQNVPFSLSLMPHIMEFYRKRYNSNLEYGSGFNIDLPVAADIFIGGKYSPGYDIAFDAQVNLGGSILDDASIHSFGYISAMHSIKMITFGVRAKFFLYPNMYFLKESIFPFVNVHFDSKAKNSGIVVEVQRMLELESDPLDNIVSSGLWLLSVGSTF